MSLKIYLKATNALNGQIVGVDLMESNSEGLVVYEVNNTTEFKNTVRLLVLIFLDWWLITPLVKESS